MEHLLSAHGQHITCAADQHLPSCPPAVWRIRTDPGAGPTPSPALSAATSALQPLKSAAPSTTAEAFKGVAKRRALDATKAETGGPAGAEGDGGHQWRTPVDQGLAGLDAGKREAPVEGAEEDAVRGVRESISRCEAGGQGWACVHSQGARALKLGGGGNGEPLTSGSRPKNWFRRPSSCAHGLREGAHSGTSESAGAERVRLIIQHTRFQVIDAWA